MARARIAELCLQLERGEEALRQLAPALPVLPHGSGPWSDVVGLQLVDGAGQPAARRVDEAEQLAGADRAPTAADDPCAYTYGLGVRAEILLARGQVDAGLALWRDAAGHMDHAAGPDRPAGSPPMSTRGRWRPWRWPWSRTPGTAGSTGSPTSRPRCPGTCPTILSPSGARSPALPDGVLGLRDASCWLCPLWTCLRRRLGPDRGGHRGPDDRPGRTATGTCGPSSPPCPPRWPGPGRPGRRRVGVRRRGVVVRRPGPGRPAGGRTGPAAGPPRRADSATGRGRRAACAHR